MPRHLDNFERLCRKLNRRYGADDPLSQQVQADFEDSKAAYPAQARQQDWSVPYRCLIKDQSSEFMQHTRR